MKNFYDTFMAPLETKWLSKYRKLIMSYAHGHVLEVGFGTGVNLKHYDSSSVRTLTALDLHERNESGPERSYPVTYVRGNAEQLPFEKDSYDTVVETLVFCSVKDLKQAISEVFRVLKPGGIFIYLDHVLPEKPLLASAFKGANLIWPHLAGGCNLTRQPHLLIENLNVSFIESGSFANGVFRYGVAKKGSFR